MDLLYQLSSIININYTILKKHLHPSSPSTSEKKNCYISPRPPPFESCMWTVCHSSDTHSKSNSSIFNKKTERFKTILFEFLMSLAEWRKKKTKSPLLKLILETKVHQVGTIQINFQLIACNIKLHLISLAHSGLRKKRERKCDCAQTIQTNMKKTCKMKKKIPSIEQWNRLIIHLKCGVTR